MRAYVPDYELVTKSNLQEVLQTLSNDPCKWKPFAGGTDLMVLFESGKLQHKHFLNLSNFSELRKIEVTDQAVRIGTLCTYTDIQNHPVIQKEFPLVARSGWVTGAKAIQNRGTIGGNIANASPAADTPPSLLAYGAQIELMNQKTTRKLAYSQFHLDYKKTSLAPDEIISAVLLPRAQGWTHHYYRKVGTRAFQSISKIAVSAAAKIEKDTIQEVHLGLASVAATPLLAESFEKALKGQKFSNVSTSLAKDFVNSLAPMDDIRSTAIYRKVVLQRVLEHYLDILKSPAGVYLES